MFGLYLNSFVAPKILRSLNGNTFEHNWRQCQLEAQKEAMKHVPEAMRTKKYLVLENIAGSVALPIIYAHPWYAFTAWMPEVFKSTFDLYSTQLTAFANDCWKWDPLKSFYPEKLAECHTKNLCPLLCALLLGLNCFVQLHCGLSLFIGSSALYVLAINYKFQVSPEIRLWAPCGSKQLFLVGAVLFMTGGFGYARLRLPVEPLMIILALTVWILPRSEKGNPKYKERTFSLAPALQVSPSQGKAPSGKGAK